MVCLALLRYCEWVTESSLLLATEALRIGAGKTALVLALRTEGDRDGPGIARRPTGTEDGQDQGRGAR